MYLIIRFDYRNFNLPINDEKLILLNTNVIQMENTTVIKKPDNFRKKFTKKSQNIKKYI